MRATKLRVGWRLTVTLTEAVSTAHGLLLPGAEPLGAPLPSDAAIDWRPGVLMSLLPESWQVGSTWARAPATRASAIGMFWAPPLPAQAGRGSCQHGATPALGRQTANQIFLA